MACDGSTSGLPVLGLCCGCSHIPDVSRWPVGKQCIFERTITAPTSPQSGSLFKDYLGVLNGPNGRECTQLPFDNPLSQSLVLDAGTYEFECETVGNYENSNAYFIVYGRYNPGIFPDQILYQVTIPNWNGSTAVYNRECVFDNRRLEWQLFNGIQQNTGTGSSIFRLIVTKTGGPSQAP